MASPHNLNDDVSFVLGSISGKLDTLLAQQSNIERRMDKKFSDIEDTLSDHNDRIGSLEHNRSKVLGIIAAITALFGMVATFLGFKS